MRSEVAALDLGFGSVHVAVALSDVVQVIMYEGDKHGSLAYVEATRFMEPWRTSLAANTPGLLVSRK